MGILIKYGNPGVVVGLANIAGASTGRGQVEDQTFQDALARNRESEASGRQLGNQVSLINAQAGARMAEQNNAARLVGEARSKLTPPPAARGPSITPAGAGRVRIDSGNGVVAYGPDNGQYAGAGKGFAVAPRQTAASVAAAQNGNDRRAAAVETYNGLIENGMDPAEARVYAAQVFAGKSLPSGLTERISGPTAYQQAQVGLGQQRAGIAQAGLEQRGEQAGARLAETQRSNQVREQQGNDRIQIAQQRAAKVDTAGDFISSTEREAAHVAAGGDVASIKQLLGPLTNPDGPVDSTGKPLTDMIGNVKTWTTHDRVQADRIIRGITDMPDLRDKQGRRVLGLAEVESRIAELNQAGIPAPVMAKAQRSYLQAAHDVVNAYQKHAAQIAAGDPQALQQAASEAQMGTREFQESIAHLAQIGAIQPPAAPQAAPLPKVQPLKWDEKTRTLSN